MAEELRALVDEEQPDAEVVVSVTDHLTTQGPACLYERFEPAEARCIAAKIEWHCTPEHGSWLNIGKHEPSVLAGQCLSPRMPDKPTLVREVAAWEKRRNAVHVAVDWQFKAEDVRLKLKRLYPVLKAIPFK